LEAVSERPLVVLHSSRRWLKQTKTWIYQQLKWLPPSVSAHVVCEVTENLEQFPWPNLHTLEGAARSRRLLEALLRRARATPWRFSARVARQIQAEILHSHFGPDGYRELGIARAAKLKHVVTFYGYDVTRLPERSPIWRERYRELFERVDSVLCEGPHMRSELIRLGCPERKAQVQHLGADLSQIAFRPRQWAAGQPLRALLVGSFREKKGFPYALRALSELKRARPRLDVEVVVVGDASGVPGEREEKAEIMRAAAEGSLAGHIRFLGYRPYSELLQHAYGAHVLVSPSVRAHDGDTEGGAPVTIVELAASGMPIVSTTHCDIPNVLRGPAAALLAPERDVPALVTCLTSLIDAPESWASILSRVRHDIEERFDAAVLGRNLAVTYRKLLD
jgi:colanic acid/amylovoran biosynthesis glycosyltransferase